MATVDRGRVACADCERRVDVRDAVTIVVRRDDRQHRTVLCGECAVVRCPDCGSTVDVGEVLSAPPDVWSSRRLHECDRCGERVVGEEIAELTHATNRQYRKLVCADCLAEVPIPPNIRVNREVE